MEQGTKNDTVQSIRTSSLHFFSGTMLSRITGAARDISLAYCFGNSQGLSILFVALRLTYLLRRLFGEGALQSSFIPLFEQARKEDPKAAFRFFQDLSLLWTILLSCISLAGIILLSSLPQYLSLAHHTKDILDLMVIMFPSLIPICLFGLNISLLQSEKRYFISGFAPVFFNIPLIAAGFYLRAFASTDTMEYLAYAVVLGALCQWLVTLVPTLRLCRKELGPQFLRTFHLLSPKIKGLATPIGLSLLGIGASQINSAIDALFAYSTGAEGPSQLWFSIRFQQLPLGLFSVAISNAVLPPLCRAFQNNNATQFLAFIEHGIRQTVALLLPCTGALLVIGGYLINWFYGHGAFTNENVIGTTLCLQGYALSLVPAGLIIIVAPAFYAQKRYRLPALGALIALILNILLNSLFVFIFDLKALSICIATSISAAINCWFLYASSSKSIGPALTGTGALQILKSCLCTLLATLITFLSCRYLFGPMIFFTDDPEISFPSSVLEQVKELSIGIVLFTSSLLLSAKALKAEDILGFISSFRFRNRACAPDKVESVLQTWQGQEQG